ncbi:MAG: hypothetical protein ABI760_06440 [Ferruginibacter sp.]
MKRFFLPVIILLTLCCKQKTENSRSEKMSRLAENYVRLGLSIGQYDTGFVDAYYGPDSLKPTTKIQAVFPKDSFLVAVNKLMDQLKSITNANQEDRINPRVNWMLKQLIAFGRRIRIFSGEYGSFDEESRELFGVAAPAHDEKYFRLLLAKLDSILPGRGDVSKRFNRLANRFIIPKDKLDTVFKIAIGEARKRTLAHYKLPPDEAFRLEYVTGKPWSGYNWYKGDYKSIIQINTDLPVFIDGAIDLACHEGYPGHHVYNLLLEKKLYGGKGWVEISFYPLFSPQSLIAEGSANFGIEVAFPGTDQNRFIRNTLLPLAGVDTSGVDEYMTALSLKRELNYARNEAGRGLVNGTMKESEAVRWLTAYALIPDEAALKSISFIKKYRSYVINYNYGQDLVKNYIVSKGGTDTAMDKRWELFEWLLSNEVTAADLLTVQP